MTDDTRLTEEQVFADHEIMAANARIGAKMAQLMPLVRAVEGALIRQAALASAAGWKLVPVEPTQAMLLAAHTANRRHKGVTWEWDVYAAMLAAAPTAPAAEAPSDAQDAALSEPSAEMGSLATNVRRLANIGKDCGRLVSKESAWAVLHAAADALAALASPASSAGKDALRPRSFKMTAHQLNQAWEFATGIPSAPLDPDIAETEIAFGQLADVKDDDGGTLPAGLFCWLAEYPEEGFHGPLDELPDDAAIAASEAGEGEKA